MRVLLDIVEEVGEKAIMKQNRLDLLDRIKSGFKKLDYNTLYDEKFEIKVISRHLTYLMLD